jgi:hypothetical protein
MHNFERKFDREDERILNTLAQFASAGWQLWKAFEAAEGSGGSQERFLELATKMQPQSYGGLMRR